MRNWKNDYMIENKKSVKPSLKSFLIQQFTLTQRGVIFGKNGSIKYKESEKTSYLSVFTIIIGVCAVYDAYKEIMDKIKAQHIIRIITYIIMIIMVSIVTEIIHWFYVKYDSAE